MPNVNKVLRPQWGDISQQDFRTQYRQLNSLQDLANFWEIPHSQLSYYAYKADKAALYRVHNVPRRNGRIRKIEAPVPTLKFIQRIIHESLTLIYGPHRAVHGFLAERSIVTNARQHLGSSYVLNIDIEDFFPSITSKRIYGRLVAAPYSLHPKVANPIAALSTNVYLRLPQGSPSSPIIANMVVAELDSDLALLCAKQRCRYTRYADDITISTSRSSMSPHIARYPNSRGTGQVIIGDSLTDVIEKHGFRLNPFKSRLQSYWTRQTCTGLVVNGDRLSLPRPYIRRLRSLVDHWKKKGWSHAAQKLHTEDNRPLLDSREALMNHVIGRINYVRMVRGHDDQIALRLEGIVRKLSKEW